MHMDTQTLVKDANECDEALLSGDKKRLYERIGARLPVSVYEKLQQDPVSFYQLDEAPAVDQFYQNLEVYNNTLDLALGVKYPSCEEARKTCRRLLESLEKVKTPIAGNSIIDRNLLRELRYFSGQISKLGPDLEVDENTRVWTADYLLQDGLSDMDYERLRKEKVRAGRRWYQFWKR